MFAPERVLIVELDERVGVITMRLETPDFGAPAFTDKLLDIAETVRAGFFATLGDAAAPEIHVTPLTLDVRSDTYIKV